MSSNDIQTFKSQIESHTKTLVEFENKWSQESLLKQLSKADQNRVFKAVVTAKRLTSTLIPKLKFKLDSSIKSPDNPRLAQGALDEWKVTYPKVKKTLEAFERLESGPENESAHDKSKKQKARDRALSVNIEKSLQSRRKPSSTASKLKQNFGLNFSEDGGGDSVEIEDNQDSENDKSDKNRTNDNCEDLASEANSSACERGKMILEELLNFKKQLQGARDEKEDFSKVVQDVCRPDEAESVREYLQSLVLSNPEAIETVSRDILDEIRTIKFSGNKEVKAKRNPKQKSSTKRVEQLNREAIELAESIAKDKTNLDIKSKLPMPLPIDSFLYFVETLPGELQDLVREESEALGAIQKEDSKLFSKKDTWTDRKGRMVGMDKLREEFRDDRFDSSDFRIRVPDAMIDDKHLEKLKSQKICNPEEWTPEDLNVKRLLGLLEGTESTHPFRFARPKPPKDRREDPEEQSRPLY